MAHGTVLGAVAGGGVGAVAGFVLGLHHLPTLPVAVVEGAVLAGVPATALGLLLGLLVRLVTGLRGLVLPARRARRARRPPR